jgi:hypothetical protein
MLAPLTTPLGRRKERARGTFIFLLGVLLVLRGWARLGVLVELFGFLNLFANFVPAVSSVVKKAQPRTPRSTPRAMHHCAPPAALCAAPTCTIYCRRPFPPPGPLGHVTRARPPRRRSLCLGRCWALCSTRRSSSAPWPPSPSSQGAPRPRRRATRRRATALSPAGAVPRPRRLGSRRPRAPRRRRYGTRPTSRRPSTSESWGG